MIKLFTVLLIDDKHELLLPSFEIGAEQANMNLSTAGSMADGLDQLAQFSTVINAVILDMAFPAGEMQGMEGLQIIKKKYPFIPVIVLTSNDSAEDIKTAVLCIKNGAYDYVGKSTLNPSHLFHIVENAISQSRLELKAVASLQKEKEPADHPFIKTVFDDDDSGFISKYLAYNLQSVSLHHDEIKLSELRQNAENWHNYFIEVLLPAFNPYLLITILYLRETAEQITISVVFRLQRRNENDLEKLLIELQHNLMAYFTSGLIENTYTFSPVRTEEHLGKLIFSAFEGESIGLCKKPIVTETRNRKIGFGKSINEKNSKTEIYPPFPLVLKQKDDRSFITSLLNAKGHNMVCCHIQSAQLTAEEFMYFDKLLKGWTMLPEHFGPEEKSAYFAYGAEVIRQASSCFIAEVRILSDQKTIDRHLLMAVAEYFYGGIKNVQKFLTKSLFKSLFLGREDSHKGNFSCLYINQDLTNIFRLPIPQSRSYPGINFLTVGSQNVPAELAPKGILLGIKKTNDTIREIFIDNESAKKHMYILGQPGTGKSTLLKTMVINAMKSNHGLCLIDPHGDLFDEIIENIPENRKKDLFFINTNNIEASHKLNLFETDPGNEAQKTTVISEIGRILSEVYDMKNAGGPMFETFFRNASLLAMDEAVVKQNGPATMADSYRIIMDDDFRHSLLSIATNNKIKLEFETIENTTGESAWANFKPYITSKFNLFLENEYLNKLFNHKGETLNFRQIMDEEKILIVHFDKGQIGMANIALVGMIFLNKLILSIMSRSNLPKEMRKEFFVFIDEFQNFLHGDIGNALSEVRKYNAGMILANQTLGQLNDYMIQSILGNVGSTIFFRPGLNDYLKISHYFESDFTKDEVLNLPNFNCIARIMHNNRPSEPFIFQTIKM
jgi:DNA-binding response OmpR family regulator